MRIIKTLEGVDVLVDDEDFEYLHLYDLHIDKTNGYVLCKIKKQYRYKKIGLFSGMALHKLLVNPFGKGRHIVVDHKDGNKLDNQKDNLRVCTHHENMWNRNSNKTYANKEPTSAYKGVVWQKQLSVWQCHITSEANTKEFLGLYTNEIAAANMYNHFTKDLAGEFFKLNDVPYLSLEECDKYRHKKKITSRFRGVAFIANRWVAQVCHDYDNRVIGRYMTEIEAAQAYNEEALRLKGDKAKLNTFR